MTDATTPPDETAPDDDTAADAVQRDAAEPTDPKPMGGDDDLMSGRYGPGADQN